MNPPLHRQGPPLRIAAAVMLAPSLLLFSVTHAFSANIAPDGTAIFGLNDAIDGDDSGDGAGRIHTGMSPALINDTDLATRVDGWLGDQGGDGGLDYTFVGILWDAPRTDKVSVLTLTLATFLDGGWFGTPGSSPPAGGALTDAHLVAPTVQVTKDGGATWETVASTTNYLTAMTGHQIGGGAAGNPTSKTVTFTLTGGQSNLNGIRLIGPSGGVADNGFLGVFELEVEAISTDSDNDGMDDEWETANGLAVGTNDAGLDKDNDGLVNLQEYVNKTDPQDQDTDDDGLNDGPEVSTHHTDPKKADTDGDGLSDGQEINTTSTNPLLADTDGDGLTDSQEVNTYATDPNKPDTDNDGYSDSVEVRFFSNPQLNTSVPANIAPSGIAIMGTSTALSGGTDTAYSQQNTPQVINDGLFNTRVDTFNGGQPNAADGFSYVGITWPAPRPAPVNRVEVVMAVFSDGGWFGVSGTGPASGSPLTPDDLTAPIVQVTTDGTTWTDVPASSNYIGTASGTIIPNPGGVTSIRSAFDLATPQANIRGIRLIGPEGGTASGGFLGVWEMTVGDVSTIGNSNIAVYGTAIMGTSTDAVEGVETLHSQQGTPEAINDGQYGTYVDTYSRSNPYGFAGVIWPSARSIAVDRVEATFNAFGDGGWFGVNTVDAPLLSSPETLEEPVLQVTTDGGLTWTAEPHTSTYFAALNGMPTVNIATPTVIFALNTPRSGINGIRLFGHQGGSGTGGFIALREFAVREVSAASANLALTASGVIGTNDAVDTDAGRLWAQAGFPRNINDGDPTTRVDTYDGAGGADPVNYASLIWPAGRPVNVSTLTLTFATFTDGGWFGPPGVDPGPGGNLVAPTYLSEPTVQVMNAAGAWSTVPATSDYLTVMNGHGIGGGANPNPSSKTAAFTLTPAVSGVQGVRVIGNGGGSVSNGFLGVWEMTAAGTAVPPEVDTDGDGQTDAEEAIAGTNPADPNSVLALLGAVQNGTSVNLVWSSVPGKVYQIQTTSDLVAGPWADNGGTVPAAAAPAASTSGSVALTAPLSAKLFFRVKVVP
ncbi:MAG: hypothetical protein JWM59_1457 [Verrucomicrobiales bacterium]|nr:hypothetical protein [Verrucomicrobiales bacterium]